MVLNYVLVGCPCCFPTLLRNDLNLSDVAHFTTHDSNLSCNKSGFRKLCTVDTDFRLDKITRELRITRALRRETSLPCGRQTHVQILFQKVKSWNLYFLQQPDLLQARFADLFVVKRTLIASQLVLQQHVFVARFTVPLRLMKLKTFLKAVN